MKTKKSGYIALILGAVLSCALFTTPKVDAQSSAPPVPPSLQPSLTAPTSIIVPDDAPAIFKGISAIWPNYDPTLTNTYNAGDISAGLLPLWKTATAAGSTPYLAFTGDYFFTKHVGMEGEFVTLGNGAGKTAIDSAAVWFKARKDVGNLALNVFGGPAHDWHNGAWAVDFGVGVEYRYTTGISSVVDTRYRNEFGHSAESGFLTRVGLKYAFKK
jgi:hypothetical protein